MSNHTRDLESAMLRRFAICCTILLATSAAVACGTDDTDPEDTGVEHDTIEDTMQDVQPDMADTAGDTSDADQDGEGGDAGPSILMPRLEYRSQPTDGCSATGGCEDGVEINVASEQITKSSPEIQNDPISDLSTEDAQMLIEEVLTEATIQKMDDGWDCGSGNSGGDTAHKLEGRITDEFPARRVIQDVTGCIVDDSAPDATRVQEIRTILLDLRTKYFDN